MLIRDLLFVDEANCASYGACERQLLLDRFNDACMEFALTISTKKTIIMHQRGTFDANKSVGGNKELETVDNFTHLTHPSTTSLGGRWVLLIVRGSTTTLLFSAFSEYVTFSSRVEMPALVIGLSS